MSTETLIGLLIFIPVFVCLAVVGWRWYKTRNTRNGT